MYRYKAFFVKQDYIYYLIGLIITLIIVSPFLSSTYIIKYDYISQHIPFYTEFYRLIKEGLPFWSWNGFLGLNFWASKTYYLIGDPYVWLSVPMHIIIKDIPKLMTILLLIKFVITYTSFYILSKYWKIDPLFKVLLSLAYTFSGWNLIFMEQVMYTSFYSLIPLLLLGLEYYLKTKKGYLLSIAVALLVSINFYLFWVASWLFLIYYVFRYLQINDFKLKDFITLSFRILGHFILGVLLTSFVWLPGILHLLQSSRSGTFLNDYLTWNELQVSSLLTFSFIPSLKYLDGLFKDKWYYFNQLGLYVGVLTLLIIPQTWFVIKEKKERLLSITLSILLLFLLVSPKIGLFFHFTYSLRYTLIHTVLLLFLASMSFKIYKDWNIKVLLITQLIISLIFAYLFIVSIPNLYINLPTHTEEIQLLKLSYILSCFYTLIIIIFIKLKQVNHKNIMIHLLSLLFVVEVFYFGQSAFISQKGDGLVYYTNQPFEDALNYIKNYDNSFYRVYTNDQVEFFNLSYAYDYRSILTYDTTYQYSLTEFLHLTRQYPDISWGFNLHDPSIMPLVSTKYEIIKNVDDVYPNGLQNVIHIGQDEDFGPYTIFQYTYDVAFAKTYHQYADESLLDTINIESDTYYVSNLMTEMHDILYLSNKHMIQNQNIANNYYQPTVFENNHVELAFNISNSSILVLNMPYDAGWRIKDNETPLDTFSVQGGFMAIYIEEGQHHIVLDFIPNGFIQGLVLSIISLILIMISNYNRSTLSN